MPTILRFDCFEFDPQSGELIAGDKRVRLEPQPAKVLAILASRRGQVVTREELQKEVWPAEVFVDFERGLNYCIGRIRRALEDSAAAPRFVETLPKRGYRFLPVVEGLPEIRPWAGGQAPGSGGGTVQPVPAALPEAAGRRQRRLVLWGAGALAVLVAVIVVAGSLGVVVGSGGSGGSGGGRGGGGRNDRNDRNDGNNRNGRNSATARTGALPFAAGPAMVPTVAVARFDNETGRAELDRAAQVLEDTLVERLAREPERWSVIGNAAILRQPRATRDLAAIGSSLHADFIVLGQILPGDRGLTVLTHLIRARDQRHLWVGRFEVSPVIAPGVADRIAAIVATASASRVRDGR